MDTMKQRNTATTKLAVPGIKSKSNGRKITQIARALAEKKSEMWNLRLYVAGQTPKSLAAFSNLKRICEEHLKGRYTLEVIDLIKNPQLAAGDQILALPTLVRKIPAPIKKIIGDLSTRSAY